MVQLICPHCDAVIAAKAKHLGREINCPKCHESIITPNAPPEDFGEPSQQTADSTATTIACPVCENSIAVNRKWFNTPIRCSRCEHLFRVAELRGGDEDGVEVVGIPPGAFGVETFAAIGVAAIGGGLAFIDFDGITVTMFAAGSLTFSLSLVCRRLLRIEYFIRSNNAKRD